MDYIRTYTAIDSQKNMCSITCLKLYMWFINAHATSAEDSVDRKAKKTALGVDDRVIAYMPAEVKGEA